MAPASVLVRLVVASLALAFADAEEPRKLKVGFSASYSPVTISGNGVSNSPIGQWSGMMHQAKNQLNAASSQEIPPPLNSNSIGSSDADSFDSFGPSAEGSSLADFMAPDPPTGMPMTPESGSKIMQGLIGSFLADKKLQEGEVQCLQQGCSAFGSSTIQVANSMSMIMKQFQASANGGVNPTAKPENSIFGSGGMLDQMSKSAHSTVSSAQQSMQENMAKTLGRAVEQPSGPQLMPTPATTVPPQSAGDAETLFNWASGRRLQAGGAVDPVMMMGGAAMALQLGSKVKEVGELGHSIMSKCLQGDGKNTLLTAAKNAENPEWLSKSFMNNGMAAMGTLSGAQKAWENGDAKAFGSNLGTGLREVFFSTDTSGKLPEGLPPKKSLMNVTGGFMKGFFGPGWTATIKTPEAPNGIIVDLNKCIGDNVGLLETMWSSVMYYYASQDSKTSSVSAASTSGENPAQKKATMLAYTMLQVPSALNKCGINQKDRTFLKDAIASMGKDVSVTYSYPEDLPKMTSKKAAGDVAHTVSGYSKLVSHPDESSYEFGQSLGNTFQTAATTALQQKYYVDEDGNLRLRLLELAGATTIGTYSSKLTPMLLALTAGLFVSMLIAIKTRLRNLEGWHKNVRQADSLDLDLEDTSQAKPCLDNAVE